MEKKSMPSREQLAQDSIVRLRDAQGALEKALDGTDARAVFASYSLTCFVDTSKGGPSKSARPGPAAVESAAWVLMPFFGQSSNDDPARIQSAIDALEAYQGALSFSEIFTQLPEGESDDELSSHLRLHSGMVRGSAYPQQIKARIEGILKPFETEFSTIVGIGPWRAFEIVNAICRQIEDNVNGMREAFHTADERARALIKNSKSGDIPPEIREFLHQIRKEMQQILEGMNDWMATWPQIEKRLPGVTRNEWDALRHNFGLTPESRSKLNRLVDVQDRPLFFLDDEKVLFIHAGAIFDAIFSYYDDIGRTAPSLEMYRSVRIAEWMEATTAYQFEQVFPSECIYRSACYPNPDKPGDETEADLVVIWGPFLLVAEVKGRRIAKDAMRGSKGQLKQAVRANIQDAFIQARRLVRAIEAQPVLRIREKATGRICEIRQEKLRRIMPVSVTLQHLFGIPTQLATTQRLGLFKGNAYPWSVSIDDLDVITRFAGSPDVLLHYIERRTAHQNLDVSLAGDELDIFGQYLDNRLHPEVYEGRPDIVGHDGPKMIAFNGGEERFEKFYFADWEGEASPDEKVGIDLPPEVHKVLLELRNRRDDDSARWIAFALLGLSGATLQKIDRAITQLRNGDLMGRPILRITCAEDKTVINVMVYNNLSEQEFTTQATVRTRIEHYRAKAAVSLTLGINQSERHRAFASAIWLEAEWEYEEVMERIMGQDRERPRVMQLLNQRTAPGRNDPCICGSGRKFKKCCIDRVKFERR